MIYVATVHYESALWIDIQLGYLQRNLGEPFRTVTCLERVPGDHDRKFDLVVPAVGAHAGKLNLLAGEIAAIASPDDLVMFLDGDAFPIADPMPLVHRSLETTALVAVRRDENGGDPQPHPCFCVIRVGDWERLHGDWSPGHCWTAASNVPVTDVGGNLLRCLERNGAEWTPILRSNRVDLHPVFFGVYGDIVYHQGAGFRSGISRADRAGAPPEWTRAQRLPKVGTFVKRVDAARLERYRRKMDSERRPLMEDMIRRIQEDPEFYRALI